MEKLFTGSIIYANFRAKIIIFLFVFSICAAVSIPAAAESFSETLPQMEETLWGEKSSQTVERRVERLELQLYGHIREGKVENRIESLADYILPGRSAPSLTFLLSSLETHEFGEPQKGSLLERLQKLEERNFPESEIDYSQDQSPIVPRLHELFQIYGENNSNNPADSIPTQAVELTPGMTFSAHINTDVNSGDVQTGRLVDFTLAEDFIVDDTLVLPAGTEGRMRVRSAESAGYLGRDGRLYLEDHTLQSLDGQRLRFSIARREPEGFVDSTIHFITKNRSRFFALGAGIGASLILDHPGGMIFSFAVPGREDRLQQSQSVEMKITTKTEVYGIPYEEY